MAHTPFRLGYFTRFGPTAWQAADDRLYGDGWETGQHHISLAKRVEAAKFDFMFFDDTALVSRALGDSMDMDLRLAISSPRHDPFPLLPLLAQATEHLGLVATASTTFYPPFILSRLLSTIDSLSGGRVGWNIVTSAEDAAAQNHNLDKLPDHSERYAIADEFVEVAKALWAAYDPDAVIKDVERNSYVDPAKVREIAHVGEHFKVRGPMNVIPSPQGRPTLMQAGASPRGRDFAAKHADAIFAPPIGGLDGMRELRQEFKERAAGYGRNPDDIKIFWAASLMFLEPGQSEPAEPTQAQIEYGLMMTSQAWGVDLTRYPLDEPLPEDVESHGSTTLVEPMREAARAGVPLGKAVAEYWNGVDELGLVGTPEVIAEKLIDAADEIGGDGFMFIGCDVANRAWNDGLIDGVVPILQEKEVVRTSYTPGLTLRQSLLEEDWTTRSVTA